MYASAFVGFDDMKTERESFDVLNGYLVVVRQIKNVRIYMTPTHVRTIAGGTNRGRKDREVEYAEDVAKRARARAAIRSLVALRSGKKKLSTSERVRDMGIGHLFSRDGRTVREKARVRAALGALSTMRGRKSPMSMNEKLRLHRRYDMLSPTKRPAVRAMTTAIPAPRIRKRIARATRRIRRIPKRRSARNTISSKRRRYGPISGISARLRADMHPGRRPTLR